MRILAIRGARLASLEAPFEVDLSVEPLRSAGVFAIVGPTGAGKSSLLDALCLALFDTTPRLERTPRQRLDGEEAGDLSGSDARTLVRRGADDAFAEVDFVGVDGRTYRARWAAARGRTGRFRPTQLSLRDVATGRVSSGTKGEVLAAIEAKLGLGLAELRRAVLLPQGEVAAFLDAPSDERALLLERLTGAEIFAEVSKVVHARASDARRARENAEITRGMLTVLPPEQVERTEGELVAARLDAARADERAAALAAQRDRRVALGQLRREEASALAALDEIENQRSLVELARGDVELADRAEALVPPLEDERRAHRSHREALARCEAERAAHAGAASALAPLADTAREAQRALAALEATHAAARAARQESVRALRERWLSIPVAPSDAEIDDLRGRARALTTLASALDQLRAADAAAEQATREVERAEELARSHVAAAERLDARALELALDATSQSARLDEAQRARERALLARSLEAHRATLLDGQPCPLCGATAHPLSGGASDEGWSELDARVVTIRLALDRTRGTLSRVQASVHALRREASSLELARRAGEAELARARHEADRARARLAASDEVHREPQAIARALAEVDAQTRALDEASRRERAARSALETAEALARAADEAAAAARADASGRALDAAHVLDRARERVRAFAESVERHELEVDAAAQALAACTGSAARALEAAGVARADATRVLGVDRDRIRRARAELARLDHERARAHARLDERRGRRVALEQLCSEEAGEAEGEALDARIGEARAAREVARRREATLEAALAHDRAIRQRVTELDEACVGARREEARWEGLDASIGSSDGKRFRAHAQSLTLARLIGFANAELAHLAPRFTLARAPAAGEIALSVVDREAGYARRAVQSLSGGESFLVSLALALGLAAMTAAEGGRDVLRASSLFLDEGLGALDPASLEIALGALEALRASGRQIAIVTHVPQVAERFAARVEVVPRGSGRSEVRVLRG